MISNYLRANWKTTTQAFLSAVIGFAGISFPTGMLTPHQAMQVFVVGAVAKIGLGLFQQDAGSTVAQTPQGVQVVDSHETPNDPSAKAVSKQ